ncbi:MAG: hypothetical protein JRI25_28510 [Deltaproteobacteria bacterium]|nr:hypothetical protein [Deltaproteobacteria bacterium]
MLALLALLTAPAHAGFFVDFDGSPCAALADAADPVAYVDEWGRVYQAYADKVRFLGLEDLSVRAVAVYFDPGDVLIIEDEDGVFWEIPGEGDSPLGKSFGAPLTIKDHFEVLLPGVGAYDGTTPGLALLKDVYALGADGQSGTVIIDDVFTDHVLLPGVFILDGAPAVDAGAYAKHVGALVADGALLTDVGLADLAGDYVNEFGMPFGLDAKAGVYAYIGHGSTDSVLPLFVDWGVDAKHGVWMVDGDEVVYVIGENGIMRNLNDLLYIELDAGRK